MFPEIVEVDVVREPTAHQGAGSVRREDLAAMCRGRDPGRAVDVETHQVPAGPPGLSRMEPHPDPDRCVPGPGLGSKRALRLDRGGHGLPGAVEDHEKGVALGALLGAAVACKRGAQ